MGNLHVAVLVAAVASFIIGALWYSPMLFGNAWMKMVGLSKSEVDSTSKGEMAKLMILNFIATIVAAYVLAYTFVGAEFATLGEAVSVVIWLWLGFIVTTEFDKVLWAKSPFNLFLLNTAYKLVTFVVMTLIIFSMIS